MALSSSNTREPEEKYFDSIPEESRYKLDKQLDFEHDGVQTDLGKIADSMDEWEGLVADKLQLTRSDIAAIREKYPKELKQQTRAALQKWQEKSGLSATYRNLIKLFVRAKREDYATTVCDILRKDGYLSPNVCPSLRKRGVTGTTPIGEKKRRIGSLDDPGTSRLSMHEGSQEFKVQTLAQQSNDVLNKFYSPVLLRYANYLKMKYKNSILPDSESDKFPHFSHSKFINLALVKKRRVSRAKADKFTKATLHGHIDEILKKKKPITLEEVLIPNSPDMKCVFVEGAPGIGKSVCVGELCRKWDEIDALKTFSLVILFRLREKRVQEAQNIHNLCYHRDEKLRMDVASEIEACDGKGILLILDGFDELPNSLQQNSIFVDLIQGTYLPYCTVLVTSRPSATANLLSVTTAINYKQIEIVGFTEEHIKQYATESFSSQPDVLNNFLKYIYTYPAIRSMMYIPLNSVIVVDIYRRNKSSNKPIPKTLTQLYTKLSVTLLNRYIMSEEHPQTQQLQVLEDLQKTPHETEFYSLAEFAFEGLANDKVIFHSVPSKFNHFDFMNSSTEMYVEQEDSAPHFSFLHLTIQEFLAAFYISHLLSSTLQKLVFEKYCDEPSWDLVWRFVAGLTGFEKIGWDLVKSRRGPEADYEIGNLKPFIVRCAYEAKDKVKFDSVVGGSEAIFNGYLTAFDCYAIGYSVAHSKCMWNLRLVDNDDVGDTFVEMFKLGLDSLGEKNSKEYVIPNVRVLDVGLVSTNLDKLSELIPHMTNLEEIDVCSFKYRVKDSTCTVKLLQKLMCLKNLKKLTMSARHVDNHRSEALSCLIKSTNANLETVCIVHNLKQFDKLTLECADLIFKTVFSPSLLRSVELTDVVWSDHAVKLLEANCNLTSLYLHCNDKVELSTTVSLVALALHKNSYLKNLAIWSDIILWDLTDYEKPCGMKSIAEMLKVNNTLESLDLTALYHTDDELLALNKALQYNHTLKRLEGLEIPEDLEVKLDDRIVHSS